MTVVEESAVAVDLGIAAFSENVIDQFGIQMLAELSSFRSLDTVSWPEGLWDSIQINGLTDVFLRMIVGKADVVFGMPVLRGDYEFVVGYEFVDDGDSFISLGHGESSSGKEVVLNVYDDESGHGF